MASSFFTELWEGIFTPGPTPTLLKATNASFAALQLVLLLLLVGTRSIHFVVLSVLCAGLWWSINWFAAELAIAQALEREEAQRRAKTPADDDDDDDDGDGDGDGDSETEVEVAVRGAPKTKKKAKMINQDTPNLQQSTDAEPVVVKGEIKHRGAAAAVADTPKGTQSSASTEDEWEKISENEKDKEK